MDKTFFRIFYGWAACAVSLVLLIFIDSFMRKIANTSLVWFLYFVIASAFWSGTVVLANTVFKELWND